MEPRYTIYFAGELLEGRELAEVRNSLARLFNADQQTLDRLFSGKAQILKRDCDKATALKYKQAMEGAGARPIVQSSQEPGHAPVPATAPEPAAPTPPPQPAEKPMTAAERIAALAAAPDVAVFGTGAEESNAEPPPPPAPAPSPGEPDLAPAGDDILVPEERQNVVAREIDTAGLEISAPVERLSPEPEPPPAPPDTSHMDMGEVGDTIPNLPHEPPPPVPHTEDIDLAPVGADFSEFAPPDPEAPDLDLSDMNLAPSGTDVLEEKYRQRDVPGAPPTDHISLED